MRASAEPAVPAMGDRGGWPFRRLNAGPSWWTAPLSDQPVNLGAASFFAQRWNESLNVLGRVPEFDANVTFATSRWTPIRSLRGLTRSWNRPFLPGLVSVAFFFPSRKKTTLAIFVPRMRALNALPTQPVGPSSLALPGTMRSGRTSWAGWVSVVSASSSSETHLPRPSQPVTVAVLCTAVSPTAVWTEQL